MDRTSRSRSPSTSGRAWPTTPAPGAPSGRCTSTGLPPCSDACPAGEHIQRWLYDAEDGRLRARLAADHGRQPVPRDHRPGLLPPVRDPPATAASSTRPSASTPSSASSATRHPAGWTVTARRRAHRSAGARRRRRPGRALGGLPPRPARPPGHRPRRAAAARRHDALRHPDLPAAPRRPRRRDRPDPGARHGARARHPRRRRRGCVPRTVSTPSSWRSAPARPRTYIPAGDCGPHPRRRLDCCTTMEGEDARARPPGRRLRRRQHRPRRRPHRPAARRDRRPGGLPPHPRRRCRPTTRRSPRRSRKASRSAGSRPSPRSRAAASPSSAWSSTATGFPQPTGELEELAADTRRARARTGHRLSLGCTACPASSVTDGAVAVGPGMTTGHPGIFAAGDVVASERTVDRRGRPRRRCRAAASTPG